MTTPLWVLYSSRTLRLAIEQAAGKTPILADGIGSSSVQLVEILSTARGIVVNPHEDNVIPLERLVGVRRLFVPTRLVRTVSPQEVVRSHPDGLEHHTLRHDLARVRGIEEGKLKARILLFWLFLCHPAVATDQPSDMGTTREQSTCQDGDEEVLHEYSPTSLHR